MFEPMIRTQSAFWQVLLEVGGAAAPERGAQTGHRGAVSYPRLVLDLDRAQGREELLDQVVLLVVERRAAEVGEAERAVDPPALVVGVLPAVLARRRSRARRSCPSPSRASSSSHSVAARAAVLDLREAVGLLDELARGRALRAERALVDRRARVALDVDELAAARVDDLAAADRAVGADRLGGLQPGDPRAGLLGLARRRARAHAPVGEPGRRRAPRRSRCQELRPPDAPYPLGPWREPPSGHTRSSGPSAPRHRALHGQRLGPHPPPHQAHARLHGRHGDPAGRRRDRPLRAGRAQPRQRDRRRASRRGPATPRRSSRGAAAPAASTTPARRSRSCSGRSGRVLRTTTRAGAESAARRRRSGSPPRARSTASSSTGGSRRARTRCGSSRGPCTR